MPFDSTNAVRNLEATAQSLGIDPIPPEVLTAYKQDQVARHPASWWYHHQGLAQSLVILATVSTMMLGFLCTIGYVAMHDVWYFGGVAAAFAIILGMVASGVLSAQGLRVQGPANWIEYDVYDLVTSRVPPTIAERAMRIARLLPNVSFVIGDLRQESASLDPYLLVEYGTESVVLGVWDEQRLIMEAHEDGWRDYR